MTSDHDKFATVAARELRQLWDTSIGLASDVVVPLDDCHHRCRDVVRDLDFFVGTVTLFAANTQHPPAAWGSGGPSMTSVRTIQDGQVGPDAVVNQNQAVR